MSVIYSRAIITKKVKWGETVRWRQWIRFSVRDTLVSLGILFSTTGLSFALSVFDQNTDYAAMLYVLAVFLIARMTDGYFYGVTASLCSVLLVNFLFTYPNFAFNFTITGYPIAIVSMLTVSIATSTLTTQAKHSAERRVEAEREKTRSNLLRAVSHDLRTPLTAIVGASSAILENDEHLSREERLELLRDVRDDAQWLIRMVENLLTITRIDQSRAAKVVKTPEVGEEVLEAVVAKFRKQFSGFELAVQIPEEFLMIPMDAVLIEQVLFNLMENVVDHGEGANRITLSLERREDWAEFSVRDNGCGIEPTRLPKLFDGSASSAGEAGDRKRNMGIGLSVCRTIIKAHGGRIEAENAPEGGAIFRFRLPMEEESNE